MQNRWELDRNEGEKEEEGKRDKDNEWNESYNLASYEIIQYGQNYGIIQYGQNYEIIQYGHSYEIIQYGQSYEIIQYGQSYEVRSSSSKVREATDDVVDINDVMDIDDVRYIEYILLHPHP